MNAPDALPQRLTSFSHGGGCGCKIAPGVLQEILAKANPLAMPAGLMVGTETSDDAAVYRINDTQAIVATTDFFMPIVDDPFDFGAIAATNAISDVYAMGGTPLFALALVGMPIDRLPLDTIRRILEGGESVCAKAGIPVAGGHTIDSVEPIYGLVAIGLVDPRNLKRNAGARPGDRLVLGKPLGIGIYSAALKKEKLPPAAYATMIASATKLNTTGIALGKLDGVHALTDVTGFGLLGHLLEICRGSGVAASVGFAKRAAAQARSTSRAASSPASGRNFAGYGKDVDWRSSTPRRAAPHRARRPPAACSSRACPRPSRTCSTSSAARALRTRGRSAASRPARRASRSPECPGARDRAADAVGRALVGPALSRIEYRVPRLARKAKRLAGASVTRVHARGKALLIDFDCGITHYSHNQLYGEWEVTRTGEALDSHRVARVVLATPARTATLYSATQIDLVPTAQVDAIPYIASLGPDILDAATTEATLRARLDDPRFRRRSLASCSSTRGSWRGSATTSAATSCSPRD